jgi:hypothetical protein
MDIFRLEAWQNEFPELRKIFQIYLGLSNSDLQTALVQIHADSLDRDRLQNSLSVRDPGIQAELFAVDEPLFWRGGRIRRIQIRPTIMEYSNDTEPDTVLVKGEPMFYALLEQGKLSHTSRLVVTYVNWAEKPISMEVEILKIPQNASSLGYYIQQLRRESRETLLKEIGSSSKDQHQDPQRPHSVV